MITYVQDFVQWLAGWLFYGIGRAITRIFGFRRTESGAIEAMLGFAILVALVTIFVKWPARLAGLTVN